MRVCKAWEIKAWAKGFVLLFTELKRRLDADGVEVAIADEEMAEGAIAGGHLGWNEGFSGKEEISTGDQVDVSEGPIGDIIRLNVFRSGITGFVDYGWLN